MIDIDEVDWVKYRTDFMHFGIKPSLNPLAPNLTSLAPQQSTRCSEKYPCTVIINITSTRSRLSPHSIQ